MNYFIIPGIRQRKQLRSHDNFIRTVNEHFRLNMMKKTRKADYALARQITMYLLYNYGGLTLTGIGKIFIKDHTTVLHSINKITDHIDAQNFPEINHIATVMEKLGIQMPKAIRKGKEYIVNVKIDRPKSEYSNKSPMGIATEFQK